MNEQRTRESVCRNRVLFVFLFSACEIEKRTQGIIFC